MYWHLKWIKHIENYVDIKTNKNGKNTQHTKTLTKINMKAGNVK